MASWGRFSDIQELGTPDHQKISIKCETLGRTSIGCPLTARFHVTNDNSMALPEQRLALQPTQYWLPCSCRLPAVPAHSAREVSLTMETHYKHNIQDLPEDFTVTLSSTGLRKSFTCDLSVHCKDLLERGPLGLPGAQQAPVFNILVFGLANGAKSSFINSILTLLSQEKKVIELAPKGGDMAHVTVATRRYASEGAGFCLRDTWGLTLRNYRVEDKILPAMLGGFLPSNFEMHQTLLANIDMIRRNESSRNNRRAHAVLFFVPQAVLASDEETAALSENLNQVIRAGYNPVVVMSKADELCQGVLQDSLGHHPEIESAKAQIASRFGIPAKNIIHNVNYTQNQQKNFQIDRLNYHILQVALDRAQDWCTVNQPLMDFNEVLRWNQVPQLHVPRAEEWH